MNLHFLFSVFDKKGHEKSVNELSPKNEGDKEDFITTQKNTIVSPKHSMT
jgi:hypothetical protein